MAWQRRLLRATPDTACLSSQEYQDIGGVLVDDGETVETLSTTDVNGIAKDVVKDNYRVRYNNIVDIDVQRPNF